MKILGLSFWKELGKGFIGVLCRFPLAVLCAIVCAVSASIVIDPEVQKDIVAFSPLVKLAFASGLGISTFILTGLIGENVGGKFSLRGLLVSAAGLLFVMGFGLLIPIDDQGRVLGVFGMQLLMMGGIVHLGIAVCPFPRLVKTDSALWEYNKLLLIRALLSAFCSWVFFVGVALALVSIDSLFGVDVEEENYGRLWFFCAFVLTTCLFLGGVPAKDDRPQLVVDYPKWLHFFCKFILLPLVVLFFGILYAYAVKIVVTWSWPDGMVGMPVFILAAVGGLTGLLIWPLTQLEPVSKWAKSFWRLYFPLIIPLGILLLLALQRRIGDYGFTEVRFLGLVLACWLLAIALYYTVKPGSSFRVIPWSLIGILIVCSWGPLSPGQVAFKSQWKRLHGLLTQEGLLVDGSLTPNPHQVDDSVYRDLKSVIQYLHGNYGVKPLNPLLDEVDPSFRTDSEGRDWMEASSHQFAKGFMEYTGLISSEGPGLVSDEVSENFSYQVRANRSKPVSIGDAYKLYAYQLGYDIHRRVRTISIGDTIVHHREDRSVRKISVRGTEVHLTKDWDTPALVVLNSGGEELTRLDLIGWIEAHDLLNIQDNRDSEQTLDQENLTYDLTLGDLGSITIMFRFMRLERQDGEWLLRGFEFWVLVPAE